jgi:hypothetical protein
MEASPCIVVWTPNSRVDRPNRGSAKGFDMPFIAWVTRRVKVTGATGLEPRVALYLLPYPASFGSTE